MKAKTFEGWVSVFESGTDYEIDIVRSKLEDAGIPTVIMTKKDSAFKLTVGALSRVYIMVAPESASAAISLLSEAQLSLADLTEAALAADPEHVDPPGSSKK